MVRLPPAEVITPKVERSRMFVPGAPQLGVLVTPAASSRASRFSRSLTRTRLISETERFREDGLRNSPKYGGSGEIVYCDGSDTNLLVSKYGFSTLRVTGSIKSPSRSTTGPDWAAFPMRIGRPLLSLMESGLPAS